MNSRICRRCIWSLLRRETKGIGLWQTLVKPLDLNVREIMRLTSQNRNVIGVDLERCFRDPPLR
jgi:hypothetical protein